MKHDNLDPTSRKAHDSMPVSIPGDPFSCKPANPPRPLEPEDTADGSTRSPAEPGDIGSFDLGGGD